jgi:hypothetical protein
MSLCDSVMSVQGPLCRLHFEATKLLNFDFNSDYDLNPDSAVQSNEDADPDPASQNNADPVPQT